MKKLIFKLIILLAFITISLIFILPATIFEEENITNQFNSKTMKITSLAFEPNSPIATKYTCQGKNISPPLSIAGVPQGAVSLVLIVDDPDAPSGDFVHLVLFNISPAVLEIKENSLPNGATIGTNDFNKQQWNGPCPPSGLHRYQFKLYALDKMLDLASTAKKADVIQVMNGHILDQALLIGTYQKN